MSRLIAFGCSYTYGVGLEDCYIAPKVSGPYPSKFAFPNLVAQELNLECHNMAVGGYSNLAILDSILNYNFLPNDIVLVLWTFKNRDMVYKKPDEVEHKGRWIKEWMVQQNTYDLIIKGFLHIHHAYLFLKNKNINFYFLDADWYVKKDMFPNWMSDVQFLPFDFQRFEFIPPIGLDNLHPGHNFHKVLAEFVVKNINGQGNT